MARYPGFIGGSKPSQSSTYQGERTVNFYVDRPSGAAKTDGILYPSPGFVLFATASGTTRGRAILEENGRCFAVIGDKFVEIAADGTVTPHGSVVDDGQPARIASNGDAGGQLAIASGGSVYSFTLATDTLAIVPGLTAQQVDAIDGFIVALDRDTSTLWASAAFDATVFDSYKQRDARPDPWQAVLVIDRSVYLFGERSTDIYWNAGASPFPLEQQAAGAFPFGTAAPHSVANVGSAAAWLGRSGSGIGMVMLARGSSVQEISTPEIRWQIATYHRTSRIDDAIGFAFEYLGHPFYVLTFPTADATWVYDLATGEWLEFLTWNAAAGRYHAWRAAWNAVAFGRHLFLNRSTGEVHAVDETSLLDVTGETIRRLRRPPTLFDGNRTFTLHGIEVLMETGIASSEDPPKLVMNYSRNGGKTWNQASAPASVGKTGDYDRRVRFRRLGTGREFTPEFVGSDGYPYRLMGVEVTLTPGAR